MTIQDYIKLAIEEDVRNGDITSLSCIPSNTKGQAKLIVKENGIIAGVSIAKEIINFIDSSVQIEILIKDGESVLINDKVITFFGNTQSILKAERLILNIMQRMSGIATKTRQYVALCENTKAKVLDTRKTTPNFRIFEKMAVKIGGGINHRFGLYDMIMIKDNHIDYAGGIEQALKKSNEYIKNNNLDVKIEIEARNLEEVEQIISFRKCDRIMLDNFNIEDTKVAVKLINQQFEIESSGNINLNTIRDYALCGVDFISVGDLTHSIKSLDLSLKAFQ